MVNRYLYRAKEVRTKKWVYGNYVNRVQGCVPIIITGATMNDSADVDFDFEFVDGSTVERVAIDRPLYIREKTYYCPYDCGGEEFDEWGEVAHCPDCRNKFGDWEKPNFCPKCGLPLDWSR